MRRLTPLAFLALGFVAACSSNDDNDNRNDDTTDEQPGPGDSDTDTNADTDSPWTWSGPLPNGTPVETRTPNAPSQTPAFPGQTRAPGHRTDVDFQVRVVADGLQSPWAVAQLPDGALLVTERPGRLRLVATDGTVSAALAGVPAVFTSGQAGLLDVVLDPSFATNNRIFFTYSEPRDGGSATAVGRARLVRDGTPALADFVRIWQSETVHGANIHYGSRIAFARDGAIFVTVGERGVSGGSGNARDLSQTNGKVIRIDASGAAIADNPFVSRAGARPEIWSSGHRNPQSAAVHPGTGELWTVEHGAQGGDEVNIVRAGRDYGWPTVTYGEDYSGEPIGDGITALEGVEQPVYYWDPVIAPSGAAFYAADAFPAWRGSLFIGGLGGGHLARLTLDGDRIIGEERLLTDRGSRIRDVRVSNTGTLLVVDDSEGQVIELAP